MSCIKAGVKYYTVITLELTIDLAMSELMTYPTRSYQQFFLIRYWSYQFSLLFIDSLIEFLSQPRELNGCQDSQSDKAPTWYLICKGVRLLTPVNYPGDPCCVTMLYSAYQRTAGTLPYAWYCMFLTIYIVRRIVWDSRHRVIPGAPYTNMDSMDK